MEYLTIKSCKVDHIGGLDGDLIATTIDNERWRHHYGNSGEDSAKMIADLVTKHGRITTDHWEKMPDRRLEDRRECDRDS